MAELQLLDPYNQVLKRDGTTVFVENFSRRVPLGFESFTSGSAGYTLKSFEYTKFEGDVVIEDLSRAYPTLTIRDFIERPNSAFTLSGSKFNAGASSMIMGVTFADGNQTISIDSQNPSTINVLNTANFDDSGHIFTSSRSLIEYISKTATSFTGYVKTGPNTISNGNEMVQFSGPE